MSAHGAEAHGDHGNDSHDTHGAKSHGGGGGIISGLITGVATIAGLAITGGGSGDSHGGGH